jgi:hypothetical protein
MKGGGGGGVTGRESGMAKVDFQSEHLFKYSSAECKQNYKVFQI